MDKMREIVAWAAVLALGLSGGAMLAEAAVLVPYWKTLSAEQFYAWYAANASLLVDFYSPLEIVAAVLALLAALMHRGRGSRFWNLSAALSLLVIGFFFVYFKDANAGFLNRAVPGGDIVAAIDKWGAVQWARVAVGAAAFAAGISAIKRSDNV